MQQAPISALQSEDAVPAMLENSVFLFREQVDLQVKRHLICFVLQLLCLFWRTDLVDLCVRPIPLKLHSILRTDTVS